MWNFAVDIVVSAVSSVFSWFGQIMDAIPGAWDTIFTIIVILIISRFLLSPVLDFALHGGSDEAQPPSKPIPGQKQLPGPK